MRAFVSTGGNRLSADRKLLPGQIDGRTIAQTIAAQSEMAVSEARAILAETEPISRMGDTRCWRITPAGLLPHPPQGFWAAPAGSARTALAEALAAFVADGE